MLGAVRTPKKEAAWKANGERLKRMYANARKVGESPASETRAQVMDTWTQLRPLEQAAPFIAPKGSFSKEDLKAMIRDGRVGKEGLPADTPLSDTPHAPFDVNLEGEPHRVTTMGKRLGLYYIGGGEPVFTRYLQPGELESFWEKRIQ